MGEPVVRWTKIDGIGWLSTVIMPDGSVAKMYFPYDAYSWSDETDGAAQRDMETGR